MKKRKWYKKKRYWLLMVIMVIWFILYWNYPETVFMLSLPFILLGLTYLLLSLIIVWYGLAHELITGKFPSWLE